MAAAPGQHWRKGMLKAKNRQPRASLEGRKLDFWIPTLRVFRFVGKIYRCDCHHGCGLLVVRVSARQQGRPNGPRSGQHRGGGGAGSGMCRQIICATRRSCQSCRSEELRSDYEQREFVEKGGWAVAIVSNAPDYQLASECAKMILLTTASLRGAHLQSAQSAYERACIGLTPGEIEQARSFA